MSYYPFRFDIKRLRPLLQRDLYKDPDVALRELAQNAHDAIQRRSRFDPAFKPMQDGKIVFSLDEAGQTLNVSDNGIGMTRKSILDVFRFYGRSDKGEDEVGVFGLGAKSIFATADSFTIHTKSLETGETQQVYATVEGLAFQPHPPPREECGTTIAIPTRIHKDHDTGDEQSGNQTLNLKALNQYCRCVKVPIYVKRNDKLELVSQQTPWHESASYKIDGEGFEVHLSLTGGALMIYLEGFFICEMAGHIGDACLSQAAVNITRKDLIDVTMSRDAIIKNKKCEAFIDSVAKTIAEYANNFQFDNPRFLRSGGWKFVRWLNKIINPVNLSVNPIGVTLGGFTLKTIEAIISLTTFVSVTPSGNELEWYPNLPKDWYSERYEYNSEAVLLLRLLLQNKPVYYAFGERRARVDEKAHQQNVLVITHPRTFDKEKLVEWCEKLGIEPLQLEKSKRGLVLYTPYGQQHCDDFNDVTRESSRAPVYVFPRQTEKQRLQRYAKRFNFYAIKLRDKEKGKRGWTDLRQNIPNATAVFKTAETDSNTINVHKMLLAPLEYYYLAAKAENSSILFPSNLTSLCLLLSRGAEAATFEDLKRILKQTLPDEATDHLPSWFEGSDHCCAIASLSSILDWKHPYTPVLFELACKDSYTTSMVVRTLAKTKNRKKRR